MAKKSKAAPEASFRHYTSIGSNGETLYACPMEIKTQADLDNYGIGWDACRTLHFGDSETKTVYFLMVESRELAEYQWRYLDSQHRRGFMDCRCWIPGKQKEWIRCPDTNICKSCPFNEQRMPATISWDCLIASGHEPKTATSAEDQVFNKLASQEAFAMMAAEDVRIVKAVEMKMNGYKGVEIAAELGISSPRVSNLMARAREIIENYKRNQ